MENYIDTIVAANKVVVFCGRSWEPRCAQAKDVLNRKEVIFKLIELDDAKNGKKIQAILQRMTGRCTLPYIFIGGEYIGGNIEL